MDGFDLAERIRAEANVDKPKMIMISSFGRPGDMERRRQLGIERGPLDHALRGRDVVAVGVAGSVGCCHVVL